MTIGGMEYAYPYAYWHDQDPAPAANIDVTNWFEEETIPDPIENDEWVSERELGWLLAQGWVVVESQEVDGRPPERKYKLRRTSFKNKTGLNTLLLKYISLFNEGRNLNDTRYDDLVVMYSDLLSHTHSHLNRQAYASNAYETLFVNTLDSIISQIDFYLDMTRVDSASVFDDAVDKLNAFVAKLNELESGNSSFKAEIESLLTTQGTSLTQFTSRVAGMLTQLETDHTLLRNEVLGLETADDATLSTHVTDYEAKLAALETAVTTVETQLLALIDDFEESYTTYRTETLSAITSMESELNSLTSAVNGYLSDLDTELDGHEGTYRTILNLFVSDYTTHAATTRALLVDLGTTETARINEKWDNVKAENRQKLTDRGFYSSALITTIDALAERERSEDLGQHNDRLAREKLQNEHMLYGQLFKVRDKQTAGEAYIHSLISAALKYRAEWSAKLYEQSVSLKKIIVGLHGSIKDARNVFLSQESAVREKVFSWGQQARQAVIAGKDRVYVLRRAIQEMKIGNRQRFAEALNRVRQQTTNLYDKELAARNAVDAFASRSQQEILTFLNRYIEQHGSSLARYTQQAIAAGQFLSGVRERTAAMAMQTRFQFAGGLTDVNNAQQNLMKFQLDARNNLAVGMFGFMERRTDEYVDFPHITQMIMDLAASGPTQWASE